MSKKRVLLSGSKGFVGRKFRELLSGAFEICEIDGDVLDDHLYEPYKDIDIFVHLAAKSFVPDSWENPSLFYTNNTLGTQKVLDFCAKNQVRLVYISSYMYGRPQKVPSSEKDRVDANNPYAHSKLLAEELCEFYSSHFGLQTTIVRPFNLYGPSQKEHFLIPTIINQALNKGSIELNTLAPKRDYLFIDDFIEALRVIIDRDDGFEIYNCGYGKSYSVRDIAKKVADILGKNIDITDKGLKRKNEIMDVVADISKIKSKLGWYPKTSIDDGLSHIIKGFDDSSFC